MAQVRKEALEQILKLLAQDLSTEDIAKITNYSVGTIRLVIAELREKYNVSSKTGVVTSYLNEEILKIKSEINSLLEITDPTYKIIGCPKPLPKEGKTRKRHKNF